MIGFTGGAVDRDDALRGDARALRAALDGGRVLVLDGIDPVVGDDGGLLWRAAGGDVPDELLFLGGGRFAPLVAGADAGARSGALMAALSALAPADAALYAAARSMIGWHGGHGWCARCGAATVAAKGGWARVCGNGHEQFPRTDPVVIMLAEHDGRVLLGRQPAFPPGRYSALAGFVEPGESIEAAVERELFEEAGVRALSVRYLASQPWPFPSQLMIGCLAPVADARLSIDGAELEDAFWATRAEVLGALAGDDGARFGAPPAIAIARSLLEIWAAAGD